MCVLFTRSDDSHRSLIVNCFTVATSRTKRRTRRGGRWSTKREVSALSDERRGQAETSALYISARVLWENILGFQLQTITAEKLLNIVSDSGICKQIRYELPQRLEETWNRRRERKHSQGKCVLRGDLLKRMCVLLRMSNPKASVWHFELYSPSSRCACF